MIRRTTKCSEYGPWLLSKGACPEGGPNHAASMPYATVQEGWDAVSDEDFDDWLRFNLRRKALWTEYSINLRLHLLSRVSNELTINFALGHKDMDYLTAAERELLRKKLPTATMPVSKSKVIK